MQRSLVGSEMCIRDSSKSASNTLLSSPLKCNHSRCSNQTYACPLRASAGRKHTNILVLNPIVPSSLRRRTTAPRNCTFFSSSSSFRSEVLRSLHYPRRCFYYFSQCFVRHFSSLVAISTRFYSPVSPSRSALSIDSFSTLSFLRCIHPPNLSTDSLEKNTARISSPNIVAAATRMMSSISSSAVRT